MLAEGSLLWGIGGVLAGLGLATGGCVLRRSRRHDQREAMASHLLDGLGKQGVGFVVCTGEGGERRIAHMHGLAGLLGETTETVTSFAAFEALWQEPDREPFRALLEGDHAKPRFALLRTTGGKRMECTATPIDWEGESARLLTIRPIGQTYQKLHTAERQNDALKAELSLYQELLHHLPMPVWVRESDLSMPYCNLSYIELVDENDDSDSSDGMPALFAGAQELARAARETGKPQQERQHLIIKGRRRLFQITETYQPDSQRIIGYGQDITELEAAEADINSHLATLEDLLGSSSSAMTIFGSDRRLRFYNQAYVRMWGLDESRLQSNPTFGEVLEYLRELRQLPEQVNFPAFKQQRLRLFNEVTEPHEELIYLPDDRIIRAVAIPHSAGGLLFVYEDVSDRMALERSYNTLIAVQRETLDNLFEGVLVFGGDGRLKLYNPVFLSLWDLGEGSVSKEMHISALLEKTRPLYDVEDWESFKAAFIGQLQSRQNTSMRIERKDDKVLDCNIIPLPDGGVLLTYVDMTAATLVERSLRERNEALEAGDKLKTEFLANMSYELRSPLTSISGFAEMLRSLYVGELNDKQREYVEGIHQSSQHLRHLINDILDLSSIEAGYLTLDMSEFDVCSLLRSIMSLLSERLRDSQLTATIHCPDEISTMHADETRIRQVLFHLLSNAVKYSNEGGEITLGADREAGGIVLWVRDQGVGISTEEQRAVFDKFYRGDVGVRKSGTGLGLSMVKSFVELHGGHVSLESQPGEGTVVRCFIPDGSEMGSE